MRRDLSGRFGRGRSRLSGKVRSVGRGVVRRERGEEKGREESGDVVWMRSGGV